ncbi:flagellar hook-basal body complex protein FliE [Kineothrix alysoides]|jgi:flagellar hook-basal body complex protein FliE|uniref:Flagellar hook-basal body complex protein FliE n=1 Tax=Kineothrix alysoides TaxID=1469948 RepID=A0A4R1QRU2_9FIRM|nr:flagellar hook-basal body complex protein FliE [Kineothrix alysoides]TCL56599.1 flagellar hook-basal body complex protein FliE [Kineothrix alysoides]
MDIASLYNVTSGAVKQAAESSAIGKLALQPVDTSFDSILTKAMENINTTNSYLSGAENEEIKWALGETQNTHDLTVALGKASTALQYTVAVRDKLLDAYKEIMQIQI